MDAPPPRLLLAYRLLGWRLGPEHRDWVFRDITAPGYLLRQAVPVLAVVGLLLAALFALTGTPPLAVLPPLVAVLVLLLALRRSVVERALRQQGLDADGRVSPEAADWADDPELRRRRSVAGAVTTAVLVVVGLLVIALGPGRTS